MAQLWRNEISTDNVQTDEVVSTKTVVCCSKWRKYPAFFLLLGVIEVETMNDLLSNNSKLTLCCGLLVDCSPGFGILMELKSKPARADAAAAPPLDIPG